MLAADLEGRVDARGRPVADCGCLLRQLPPDAPELPPDLALHDVSMVEGWLRDFYAASTFNTCEHQPLPMMKGAKPMRIHMREDAVPVAIHRPATIPAHWQEKVRQDIERDIKLGVLERVPHNTPVTWCCRMHVVAKKNGEPRRVVDMRPVNAAARRQTHYVDSPPVRAGFGNTSSHLPFHIRRLERLPLCTVGPERPTCDDVHHAVGPSAIHGGPSGACSHWRRVQRQVLHDHT